MSEPQPYRGALPRPTPETKPFWIGARAGRLMLPWCRACQKPHFYPRSICPFCGACEFEWRQASGKGTVYSYVINHKPARGFEDKVPYVIAVIALAEGPRMLTNLVMDEAPTPESVRIDMPVEVVFDAVTPEVTLPKFRPAAEAAR